MSKVFHSLVKYSSYNRVSVPVGLMVLLVETLIQLIHLCLQLSTMQSWPAILLNTTLVLFAYQTSHWEVSRIALCNYTVMCSHIIGCNYVVEMVIMFIQSKKGCVFLILVTVVWLTAPYYYHTRNNKPKHFHMHAALYVLPKQNFGWLHVITYYMNTDASQTWHLLPFTKPLA